MKRLLLILSMWVICTVLVLAWSDIPTEGGVYLMITRVTTSETGSGAFVPESDGGWDRGDADPGITNRYGGRPFEYGRRAQIEFYMTPPPAGDAWESVSLQYVTGTNSGTQSWINIATRTNGWAEIQGTRGCHLGLCWEPPAAGTYLVRVYGQTTNGLANGNVSAANITKDGDELTWEDFEVVECEITGNTRPGY